MTLKNRLAKLEQSALDSANVLEPPADAIDWSAATVPELKRIREILNTIRARRVVAGGPEHIGSDDDIKHHATSEEIRELRAIGETVKARAKEQNP
jgi:hypothetical protein